MLAGRNWTFWCLLAAAVTCLGAALFPQWDEWVDARTGDRVSERRLGLWFSPIHHTVRREPPQGGFIWSSEVNWLSWSSLLVVVGIGCLEAIWRRRGEPGSAALTEARSPKVH